MITRFATLSSRLLVAFSILFMVTACGGGGGSDGGSFLPDPDGGTTYRIALTITDAAGEPTDTVTSTAPVILTAVVTKKGDGKPVSGAVVTASADIGAILPETGTALTDSDGEATFQITAGDTLGAGTLTATVENPDAGGAAFTATITFQVGQTGLRIGYFDNSNFVDGVIGISTDELAVGGSATLQLAVVDEDGKLATSPENIKLSSGCALGGLATLPAEVETVNGQAQATYTATGCGGEDEITATLAINGAVATGIITVAPLEANVIAFVSVVPANSSIALQGTGSLNRPEAATVAFRVTAGDVGDGTDGTALPGINVNFTLSTDAGGLSLANTSGTTDANGIVKATVKSGFVPTSVTVNATIQRGDGSDGPSTISSAIVVSSGLPSQNAISLQVGAGQPVNIQGALEFNGRVTELVVNMSDIFNNPVPDGTVAVFTTEYGSISPSCETVDGTCTVTWTSQSPRFPVFNKDLIQTTSIDNNTYKCRSHTNDFGPCPDDLGAIRGLRTTILVTSVGEEFFVDANGNGLYDEGEEFENLPEAFRDDNEDDVYTPVVGPKCPSPPSSAENCTAAGSEETFVDNNNDGQYSLNDDPAIYNGSLCPPEGEGIWCSRQLVNVRADTVLVMSADGAEDFTVLLVDERSNRAVQQTVDGVPYSIYVADLYNNRPAEGLPITVVPGECEVALSSVTTANSNAYGSAALNVSTNAPDPNDVPLARFEVQVGDVTRATFGCIPASSALQP